MAARTTMRVTAISHVVAEGAVHRAHLLLDHTAAPVEEQDHLRHHLLRTGDPLCHGGVIRAATVIGAVAEDGEPQCRGIQ